MAFPKIKLCWNGSRVEADWHLGLFGFYQRGTSGSRLRGIVITVRGVLAWLAGLMVVAYFTGAAALWFWLDRRPYNYVSYADLVLPTRWSGIEKLRGRALIDEGMDDIKARKWGEGLAKLRVGIARNPEEIKGRLTLAGVFTAMKARKQAIETYDGGLAFRYPGREYIETMIKSAAQGENYEWWIRTTDRALELVEGRPELAEERRWLVRQKLAALVAADRTAEALALADAEDEANSPAIAELRVLALLKSGQVIPALAFLREWDARGQGRADPQILRLQVRAFREAGDLAGMERAIEALRAHTPADPRPYVYGIVQRVLAKTRPAADAALDSFLLRFGSTPAYLHMLAAPLAEIGERAMLEQLIAHATQQGFDLESLRRFLVQALIENQEWRAAGAVLAEMTNPANETAEAWHGMMRAQVAAALDPSPSAQANLVNQVRDRQLLLSFYKTLIGNLRKAKRPATAREIITFAQGLYPQNVEIETWRKELDEELAKAQAEAAAAVVMPVRAATPRVESAATAPREELTQAAFDARLAELVKAEDYSGALRQIRETRRSRPAWLSGHDLELARMEIRLYGLAGDTLALRTAARFYITGDRLRSGQILETARDLHALKKTEAAIVLLNELVAKVPDYTPAQRLLSEWAPKPPESAR